MDIDNFKMVNDHFGHHIGDELLCSVAQSMKKNIRAIDVIVRFGGDEFGVLLANTSAGSASQVVEKLNDILLELVQNKGWPVTFSIGVATFPNPPDKIDVIIDAADAQLYVAKQKGKNRIQHTIITEKNKNLSLLETASKSELPFSSEI
jgi:diguanylate cyclase (GGDEF)-like protein